MNGTQILKEIRRRVGDVDGILDVAQIDATDTFWFQYIDSAVNSLSAKDIITATYVVSGTTIAPAPTNIDGLLIATWSVDAYLGGDLSYKLRNGSLGVRFKTGQDEISTIEAAKQVNAVAGRAAKEHRDLINIKLADDSDGAARYQ